MIAVSNNTTPSKLIYFIPPSRMKYKDNNARPSTILMIRSYFPTFDFNVNHSFPFYFLYNEKMIIDEELVQIIISFTSLS